MKAQYPDYSKTGMKGVKDSLSQREDKDLQDFLQHCSMTSGERTLKDIIMRMLQVRDVIEKPLYSLSKKDVDGFVSVMNRSNRTQWTKNATLATFKRYVKWKYKNLEMIENIKLKQAFNYQKINDSTLLTISEQVDMIKAADTFRDRAIISMFAESAIRPEELRQLRWKDIKFYDTHADVNVFSKKTKQVRTIPIKEAAIHLQRWKQEFCFPNVHENDLIFPGKVNGLYVRDKVMGATGLARIVSKLAKRAGIQRHIHPYLFRHSRLTSLYSNLPEQIVKKFAGHVADSEMPRIYSHISNKDVKEKMLEEIYHVEEIPQAKRDEIKELLGIIANTLRLVAKGGNYGERLTPQEQEAIQQNIRKMSELKR